MTARDGGMARVTRVRVTLTLDVDVDAWRDEYSEHARTARDIAQDIRIAVLDAALSDGVVVPRGIILDGSLS